jgi:predicted ribosomally synthesized peptide with nif11-like leader
MSNELTRLLDFVRKTPGLLEELRSLLATPDAAIRWAGKQGYRLTPEDVAELQRCDQELSDDELDKVAGGDDAWPPPPPPPNP